LFLTLVEIEAQYTSDNFYPAPQTPGFKRLQLAEGSIDVSILSLACEKLFLNPFDVLGISMGRFVVVGVMSYL
jgi:hypothetical protein